MNVELTELVFILDRSGSMGGLESDTRETDYRSLIRLHIRRTNAFIRTRDSLLQKMQ